MTEAEIVQVLCLAGDSLVHRGATGFKQGRLKRQFGDGSN
jgi:hypothetical protein